ncbi:HNH endonuclease signature motif containing protein [Vibrio breoganii]
MLTQEQLKERLHYNPETGVFTHKSVPNQNHRVNVGDVAGYHDERGYLSIMISNKRYPLHRLAFLYMTGSFPDKSVDHINQIRDDNTWSNLREVTPRENSANAKTNSKHGVGIRKRGERYLAYYTVGNKFITVGTFGSSQEATEARNDALFNLSA